ncbi:hypothetical protein MBH78_06805 [Oceanimonas sp. NS1]|nr:hypothetical protein [Oceanimonas sp. NS1]
MKPPPPPFGQPDNGTRGHAGHPQRNLPGLGQLSAPGPGATEHGSASRRGDTQLSGLRHCRGGKTILGDILELNYSLDERVRGQVFLQTNRPISQDDLLPTLESLLQTHGAALVHSNGLFNVVPAGEVPTSTLNPRLAPTAERGYQMLILPLRYIGAREMEKFWSRSNRARVP